MAADEQGRHGSPGTTASHSGPEVGDLNLPVSTLPIISSVRRSVDPAARGRTFLLFLLVFVSSSLASVEVPPFPLSPIFSRLILLGDERRQGTWSLSSRNQDRAEHGSFLLCVPNAHRIIVIIITILSCPGGRRKQGSMGKTLTE